VAGAGASGAGASGAGASGAGASGAGAPVKKNEAGRGEDVSMLAVGERN
jgi:beta-glucosidase